MRKWLVSALAIVAFGALGGGLYLFMRGPAGATKPYGGELEARALPEFASLEGDRWVNGEPTSLESLRGQPVLIEAWAPS